MIVSGNVLPPSPILAESALLEKCDFYSLSGFWPASDRINPRAWLNNFTLPTDRALAVYLLNAFQFFGERLCEHLFMQAMARLARTVTSATTTVVSAQDAWAVFRSALLITPVAGEEPGPTDSGHLYARMAREVAGFPEDIILDLGQALALAMDRRPIVFVDDLIGSGQQFMKMWSTDIATQYSLKRAAGSKTGLRLFYCPLLATADGASEIERRCPGVTVLPVHTLDATYDVLDASAGVWPSSMHGQGTEMLRRLSAAHGFDELGFNDLSLAISFYSGTPDATLPIFTHTSDRWTPLVTR